MGANIAFLRFKYDIDFCTSRDIIVYCVSNLRPTNQLFVAFVKHGSSHGEGTVRVSVR